jgi:hypothetical protein
MSVRYWGRRCESKSLTGNSVGRPYLKAFDIFFRQLKRITKPATLKLVVHKCERAKGEINGGER